jgi:hypothetical protein
VLLGELPVNTRLMLGSESLRLLVTNTRLVVDHVGKRGAGAVAGSSILGRLSGAVEDLFRSGGEAAKRRGIDKKSPEEVLRAHRDNFAIGNREVVNITVIQTSTLNRITILTGDEKYEFSTRTRFDNIVELFEKTLRDRLTAQRRSRPRLQR